MTDDTSPLFTEAQLKEARNQASQAVQDYFDKRENTQHDINGIKTLIDTLSRIIIHAIKGDENWVQAKNPVQFLAKELRDYEQDTSISLIRRAEYKYGIEELAEKLGILNKVLAAYGSMGTARQL